MVSFVSWESTVVHVIEVLFSAGIVVKRVLLDSTNVISFQWRQACHTWEHVCFSPRETDVFMMKLHRTLYKPFSSR